ncbi:hypothetical protein [Bacillus benzoevorans]|uniref:Fur-regulated basic protein FbpA n=1 Tax=Bacillus benzoevorans TaxID=1456 RepID=A0A7X0HTC2_9BACI|nr:hypothetical protein [Bacillus benzoevorans]MBB6446494.1 hypothetical protein [Bacillus benzoevorans]
MGILYETAIRKIYIEELNNLNINQSRSGVSLDLLTNEDLKQELAVASFRRRDVESDSEKWF